jgi:LysM repeat protein
MCYHIFENNRGGVILLDRTQKISDDLLSSVSGGAQEQGYIAYTIRSGDSVEKITRRFSFSKAKFAELNPGAKNPLEVGDRILVPIS